MAELAETVERRHSEMRNAPARQDDTQAFGNVDQERILRLIGLDPRDPKAHAVVMVARRYNLDPVLGHISIIPRSAMPYITRDGYLHIAHRSGKLDGIEVVSGPERRGSEWHAQVAVHRNDMSHAFIYPGRAELTRDNGPEMAITRAERRALRRAFAVTLPREFGDDDGTDTYPPAPILPPERPDPNAIDHPQDVADSRRPQTAPSAPPAPEQPPPYPSATAGREPLLRLPQPAGPEAETADDNGPEMIQPMQRRAYHALFNQLGMAGDDKRDERLATTSGIVSRDITSSNQLSKHEAALVISELNRLLEERDNARK